MGDTQLISLDKHQGEVSPSLCNPSLGSPASQGRVFRLDLTLVT